MSGIFLSYRRDDASGWAGRLYEHLVRDWGPDQVFMDIDTIAPGEDFREAIAHTMDTCDVVMVVIGPNWLNARDETGHRRLDDPGDTHRAEIISALTANVRVVPVLVGGATMPRVADLPEPLQGLVYRNAAVIEDRRFASDVGVLQSQLKRFAEEVLAEPSARLEPVSGPVRRGRADPMPTSRPPRAEGSAARHEAPRAKAVTALTLPMLLAAAGALVVLVWGVLIQRGWHNEFAGIRAGASLLLVGGVAAGLWARQWTWVLAAGIAGLVGLVVWILQLASTHSGETGDLTSLSADGIPNAATFAGALLVVTAAVIGLRSQSTSSR